MRQIALFMLNTQQNQDDVASLTIERNGFVNP